jgi:hypothetical protein
VARECRTEGVNLRLFVHGCNRDPEPSRTFCNRRISDGRDQKALALKRSCQVDRPLFVPDYPGMNRAAGFVSVSW